MKKRIIRHAIPIQQQQSRQLNSVGKGRQIRSYNPNDNADNAISRPPTAVAVPLPIYSSFDIDCAAAAVPPTTPQVKSDDAVAVLGTATPTPTPTPTPIATLSPSLPSPPSSSSQVKVVQPGESFVFVGGDKPASPEQAPFPPAGSLSLSMKSDMGEVCFEISITLRDGRPGVVKSFPISAFLDSIDHPATAEPTTALPTNQ